MYNLFDFIGGEKIIYQCKKRIIRFIIDVLVLIIGIILVTMGLKEVMDWFRFNDINFNLQTNYFFMMFGVFVILLGVSAIYGYLFDAFIITEDHIFIRRGFQGKINKIAKTQIKAISPKTEYGRYGKLHKIFILTNNGNIISTGDLQCTNRTFHELIDRMDYRSVATKKDLINIELEKSNLASDDNTLICSNRIFPAFIYFLYFVLIVAILAYATGINEKLGVQREFTLQGICGKYEGTYKGSPTYEICILENKSEDIYWIDVNKDVYDSIAENEEVEASGIVGYLGVVYELRIENIGK